MIAFGEYRPDVSDFNGQHSKSILNVLPRGDGYGPMPSLEVLTAALPAACRGFFVGRNSDGSVAIFGGTATNLYKINNTTLEWEIVSLSGGPYSTLGENAQWQFTQFGLNVIAVQANVPPQVFLLGTSSAFANLGGSPPQAAYVAVVGRFLMLSGILNSERKIKWSGLGDITEWNAGTDQSGEQEFSDGGFVQGVAGGEYGTILQETAIRHMTYVPNSSIIFEIDRISSDEGMWAPYSLVQAGEKAFYLSRKGFKAISPGSLPVPIGAERVDRTIIADLDEANIHLMIGVSDPEHNRIFWSYKSINGTAGLFDKLICYDYQINRWAPVSVMGEYIATVATPGTTLEGLDAIAPGALEISGAADSGGGEVRITVSSTATLTTGQTVAISGVTGTTEANGNWVITVIDGTDFDLDGSTFANAYVDGGIVGGSLDDLTVSLDEFSTADFPGLAVANSSHQLALFTGPGLEATLETAEQGMNGQRFRVRGFRPISDAETVYGSVSKRERLNESVSYSDEALIDTYGLCPSNVSTRYARGKIRIPEGTEWTFASGLEPEFSQEGMR